MQFQGTCVAVTTMVTKAEVVSPVVQWMTSLGASLASYRDSGPKFVGDKRPGALPS